jgi:hypothetical protein
MISKYTKNKLANNKLVLFLQTNGIYLVAVLFAIPYIVRYFNSQEVKDEIQANDLAVKKNNAENGKADPVIIKRKETELKKKYPNLSAKDSTRLKKVAAAIAYAFGTNPEDNHFIANIDLYNVSAWSEDEKEAVKQLKTVTGTFPIVEDYYYHLATRSHNLKTDIYKYLSPSDLTTLRLTYKKAGKNWV